MENMRGDIVFEGQKVTPEPEKQSGASDESRVRGDSPAREEEDRGKRTRRRVKR